MDKMTPQSQDKQEEIRQCKCVGKFHSHRCQLEQLQSQIAARRALTERLASVLINSKDLWGSGVTVRNKIEQETDAVIYEVAKWLEDNK